MKIQPYSTHMYRSLARSWRRFAKTAAHRQFRRISRRQLALGNEMLVIRVDGLGEAA